jgi:hypothetical protein
MLRQHFDHLDIDVATDTVFFNRFGFYGTCDLYSLGKTDIYKGFSIGFSQASRGSYYFLVSESGKTGYIFDDDSLFFVKIKPDENKSYAAALASRRNGMFRIYDCVKDEYIPVFSSLDKTDYGFSIYYKNNFWRILFHEWDSDVPVGGNITFENKDINGDGFLDMKFYGEVEVDSNVFQPVHSLEVELIFLFDPQSEVPRWNRWIADEEKSKQFTLERLKRRNNIEFLKRMFGDTVNIDRYDLNF